MKKRYSDEQIIKAIKEHEAGAKVDDICRSLGISIGTFYNWRSQFAGMSVIHGKRPFILGHQSTRDVQHVQGK